MADRLALIIANSEFDDPKLTRLAMPSRDAEALAEVLSDPNIGAFTVDVLLDEPLYVVRREIGRLFERRSRDDLLLFYYSGHGFRDDYGELYLAVKNTAKESFSSTGLDAAFVRAQLDRSSSQRKVVVLDCCHSGAFVRGQKSVLGSNAGVEEAFGGSGYGRVILTASNAVQYAWEGDELRGEAEPSVFTGFAVQGLQTGEADLDGDGSISSDELYRYVYEQVITSGHTTQTPQMWALGIKGQLVIARSTYQMRQQELEEIVLKADALYKEAVRLLEAGEYTEALENWQEVKRLIPGYPDPQNVEATARKKLSVDSSDPEVVVSAFVRKIGSDTEFHDGSIAYKTAIDALTEARSGQAVLTPDRIFTSLESLNRSYPPGRRLELQWLHNLLGHMFFWRKQTAEHMALLAADLSDDEPQFRQICLVAVPNEWNGVGRWVHVVLQRRGAAKKKRSKSNRKESVGGEEEAKRVLIVLYLQTPNTEELPELENMDHDTELPMAAFLGALLFEPPQSEKLYYLAAENFKSIE